MKTQNRLAILLHHFLLLLIFTAFSIAQEVPRLTLENMSDPSIMQAFSTPRTWWLNNNTAIIYDSRKAPQERTLEKLDPATGIRTPLLNIEKATENLKSLLEGSTPPRFSPIPQEITANGEYGLYLMNGDIFVLHLAASQFERITQTDIPEKSVRFSPDGKKLAFVRKNDLYSFDLTEKKEYRLTGDGSETLLNGTLSWVYWEEILGRADIGFWWSPDSRSIAYLQTDESEVSIQHFVDITPWTPTVTTQRYPKVGEKNPSVRVGIVNATSNNTVWSDIDKSSYEYIVRVDWIPDNKRVCIRTMNRLQTELDMHFVDRGSGESKHIFKDTNEGWINISDDLFFLKDGKHFIIASERDGYEHLYRYTMEGKLINQITKGNWAIRSSGGRAFWVRQAVTGIDEKNGWVYFTALEKSPLEKHLYRINLDGRGLKRLTDGDGTHSISMSPDTRHYFDRFSNLSSSPSLSFVRTKDLKQSNLAQSDLAGFKKYDLQLPELLSIPARDGFMLPATITKPKDFDPNKKYPVIIYVYGGPSAPQVSNAFSTSAVWENILVNNGYIAMKIDNRASIGSSKTLENLFLYRALGEIELDDLVDAVQWLKKQSYTDPDRFGIYGWSGGGSNTLLAMTRSKEFKAGIAGAGVTDFRFYDTKWGETMMKTEKENREGYEKYSLLKYAKDLHGKLLLVHGTHDDNVHIQNTWAFIQELVRANKLFELMVYPLQSHGIDMISRRHYNSVMLDFWKRNL